MKNNKIIILLSLAFSFFSCEGNLEPTIFDQITPENFMTNESDVRTAVTGVYSEFRGATEWGRYKTSWGSLMTMQEVPTDSWAANWYYTQHTDFMWQATDYWVSEMFTFFVPAVTKATAMIERIRDASVSEEIKNRYIAELRTVRALWMYDLFDLYGPVPVIVDREDIINPSADKQITRPTREWYVHFVESELIEIIASEVLKVAWDKSDYGHVTQGTAMMVLLELYMHEGGYCRVKSVGDANDYFTKAEKIAADIMGLEYYQLQPNYADIWNPSEQGNKEIIFSLPSFPIPVMGNNFLAHTLPTDYVSKQGIPMTGWSGFRTSWKLYDSFSPDDTRQKVHKTEYWNGKETVTGRTGTLELGALPMKYQENPKTDGNNDASEYVIYRYADVILFRSEAKNELFGPNGGGYPTALDLLNLVRSRAFPSYEGSVHEAQVSSLNDKDSFRKQLLQERLWEFCWEGKRRKDLIRHGEYISNALLRGKKLAKDFHELYPLPQATIYELKIDNNEGYN